MNIHIRKAEVEDLPVMQGLARKTIDKCYRSFLGNEGVDWFINSGESDKELQHHLGNCDVLLKDDTIVAFSICFENLIHVMMVDVDLHRSGLGSILLSHSEKKLSKKGHSTIRLETFEGNNQAISFYKKNNWIVTNKQEDKDHGFIRVFFEKTAK